MRGHKQNAAEKFNSLAYRLISYPVTVLRTTLRQLSIARYKW